MHVTTEGLVDPGGSGKCSLPRVCLSAIAKVCGLDAATSGLT